MQSYGNCTYGLRYEYAFVTKDRLACLSRDMLRRAQEICEDIAPGFDVQIESFTGSSRHIRLVVECSAATELTKFANSLKTVTSRRLRAEFGPTKLPTKGLWANSYMVRTVGTAKQEMEDYVAGS